MEEVAALTTEQYRAVQAIVEDRVTEEGVGELRQAMRDLAQAQARTEQRMQELAQAQARAEQRMDELAQAQARTEQQMGELTQAQARTEEEVGELRQVMRELAQAQVRTETALHNLAQQVGALSDTVGFGLEDVARVVLPGYLQRHYQLQLEGPLGQELSRKFFEVDGQPVEINLYGEGQRNGQRVVLLGEVKSRIGGSEVQWFAHHLALVEPLVMGEVWRVMFGYFIHPSAMQPAEESNILLVASYQR